VPGGCGRRRWWWCAERPKRRARVIRSHAKAAALLVVLVIQVADSTPICVHQAGRRCSCRPAGQRWVPLGCGGCRLAGAGRRVGLAAPACLVQHLQLRWTAGSVADTMPAHGAGAVVFKYAQSGQDTHATVASMLHCNHTRLKDRLCAARAAWHCRRTHEDHRAITLVACMASRNRRALVSCRGARLSSSSADLDSHSDTCSAPDLPPSRSCCCPHHATAAAANSQLLPATAGGCRDPMLAWQQVSVACGVIAHRRASSQQPPDATHLLLQLGPLIRVERLVVPGAESCPHAHHGQLGFQLLHLPAGRRAQAHAAAWCYYSRQ